MGNAGGSLHFGGDDDEEGGEGVVEQSGQAGGSGVPIEDKEEEEIMSVIRHHPATQSVRVPFISDKVRSLCALSLTVTH